MPRETEVAEDIEGRGAQGVHIAVDTTSRPYTVATFDGRERVSSWKAGFFEVSRWSRRLQKDDEVLFAKGYLRCKTGEEVDW